jgi:hypothetical protein
MTSSCLHRQIDEVSTLISKFRCGRADIPKFQQSIERMTFDEGSSRRDYIVDEQVSGAIQEEMRQITPVPALSYTCSDPFPAEKIIFRC